MTGTTLIRWAWATIIPIVLLAIPISHAAEQPAVPPGTAALGDTHHLEKSYRLVWQDEFDGPRLDRKKWQAVDDTRIGKYGHGNGESQVYRDSEGDTFRVAK